MSQRGESRPVPSLSRPVPSFFQFPLHPKTTFLWHSIRSPSGSTFRLDAQGAKHFQRLICHNRHDDRIQWSEVCSSPHQDWHWYPRLRSKTGLDVYSRQNTCNTLLHTRAFPAARLLMLAFKTRSVWKPDLTHPSYLCGLQTVSSKTAARDLERPVYAVSRLIHPDCPASRLACGPGRAAGLGCRWTGVPLNSVRPMSLHPPSVGVTWTLSSRIQALRIQKAPWYCYKSVISRTLSSHTPRSVHSINSKILSFATSVVSS